MGNNILLFEISWKKKYTIIKNWPIQFLFSNTSLAIFNLLIPNLYIYRYSFLFFFFVENQQKLKLESHPWRIDIQYTIYIYIAQNANPKAPHRHNSNIYPSYKLIFFIYIIALKNFSHSYSNGGILKSSFSRVNRMKLNIVCTNRMSVFCINHQLSQRTLTSQNFEMRISIQMKTKNFCILYWTINQKYSTNS